MEKINEAINGKESVLLFFWAPWCTPCKLMKPSIDKLDIIKVVKIGIEDAPQELIEKYKVASVPTLILIKDGLPIKHFYGLQNVDILKKNINKLLYDTKKL